MRSPNTMRFGLSTLLLLMAIFGLAIALWLEWTHEPEILYLHLYSNLYNINSMEYRPHPREWECIATISVVSGASFHADIPCHYEPRMFMAGTVARHGDLVRSNFTIDVEGVDVAYRHEQKSPIRLNSLHDFGFGDFKFAISDDPYGPPWPAK